jgi:hypothetical protein
LSGGLLAIPGGIAGLFGGVAGAMETGLTLGELIQDELREEGKEFNKENVRDLMENEELWNKIKRRAVGRGISIGAIEAIGIPLPTALLFILFHNSSFSIKSLTFSLLNSFPSSLNSSCINSPSVNPVSIAPATPPNKPAIPPGIESKPPLKHKVT